MSRPRPIAVVVAVFFVVVCALFFAFTVEDAYIVSRYAANLVTVVVFGLTTSTLLTLFVIPAVYGWVEE